MRVNTAGGAGTSSAAGAARAGRSTGGGGFHVGEQPPVEPAAAPATARGVAAVSPLLALQEIPDPLAGKRRALRRGRDLLDQLDELRIGLLEGSIPADRLDRLLASLAAARHPGAEPEAEALLDEVELRARVELAKLGRLPA